jgi:hypothetical protein
MLSRLRIPMFLLQRVAMTLNRVVLWTHEKAYSGTKTEEIVSDVSFHRQAGRPIGRASEVNITAIRCNASAAKYVCSVTPCCERCPGREWSLSPRKLHAMLAAYLKPEPTGACSTPRTSSISMSRLSSSSSTHASQISAQVANQTPSFEAMYSIRRSNHIIWCAWPMI